MGTASQGVPRRSPKVRKNPFQVIDDSAITEPFAQAPTVLPERRIEPLCASVVKIVD